MLVSLIIMILISCQAPQKKIVIALASTPRSLNPLRYKELASLTILCNIYEPFVTEDEAYNIHPLLAKFWEKKMKPHGCFISEKGLNFTMGNPLQLTMLLTPFIIRGYLINQTFEELKSSSILFTLRTILLWFLKRSFHTNISLSI